MTNHPFSGRKGSEARDRFAVDLFTAQLGKCKMCGQPINPTLRGKGGKRDAVVDHILPYKLRPDLAHDIDNLQLVGRCCHPICDSIEKRLWPDADAIAEAKRRHRPIGLDGYPID